MNEMTNVPVKARSNLTPFSWLRAEIDRLFEESGRAARDDERMDDMLPVPAFDMVEKDKNYVVTAELPGIKSEDVKVMVADHQLVVCGEKRQDEERQEDGFMLSERRYGAFERRLALPANVDSNKIEAGFEKGVLTVTMAKTNGAPERSRRIEIRKN